MRNELIRELVEALDDSNAVLDDLQFRYGETDELQHYDKALIAKARAYLETGGWTKVSDGLPVVPDSDPHVNVWICISEEGHMLRTVWARSDSLEMFPRMTHWRYAEPTPEPPKG